MEVLHNGKEAKEFLISKIVAEAERENVQLSELERKMMYFSESGWTLPDMMKVSEYFDRGYDQGDYECKIAKLIARTDRHIRKSSREDYERWWAAIRFLQREDHYILVMIKLAGVRPPGDQFRLFVTALAVVALLTVSAFWAAKYNISLPPSWAMLAALLVAPWVGYMLLRFIAGEKKADDITAVAIEKIARVWQWVSGSA